MKTNLFKSNIFLMLCIYPVIINPIYPDSLELSLFQPKVFILILVLLISIVLSMLAYQGSYRTLWKDLKTTPLIVKLLMFFTFFVTISGFFDPTPLPIAFIGTPGRLDGVLIQAAWYSLGFCFFYLQQNYQVPDKFIINTMLTGTLLICTVIIMQIYGYTPFMLFNPTLRSNGDPTATLGNQGFAGGYLAFILMLCVSHNYKRINFQLSYFILIFILFCNLFITSNRASLFGFLIVFFALIFTHKHLWKISLVHIVVFSGAILVTQWLPVQTTQFTEMIETSQAQNEDANVRLLFWKGAWKVIQDSPIFGSGAYGYSVKSWQKFTPEELDYLAKQKIKGVETIIFSDQVILVPRAKEMGVILFYKHPETGKPISDYLILDKAHNYIIDVAVMAGIPAAILLMIFVVLSIIQLAKSLHPFAFAVSMSMCVYVLYSLTWFASLTTDPIFWTLIGLGLGSHFNIKPSRESNQVTSDIPKIVPPKQSNQL